MSLIPASITTQPAALSVNELAGASFSCGVSGVPVPSLQWYRDGNPILGATEAAYTIPSVALADNGAGFQVVAVKVVSNLSYGVTSSVATLTVSLVILTEFMAENTRTIRDEDGKPSDWVELYNARDGPISIAEWYLTDDPTKPAKWQVPHVPVGLERFN